MRMTSFVYSTSIIDHINSLTKSHIAYHGWLWEKWRRLHDMLAFAATMGEQVGDESVPYLQRSSPAFLFFNMNIKIGGVFT